MHWIELLPSIAVGCLLLILPGILMLWSLGARRPVDLLHAPIMSVGMLAVAAVLCGLLGVRWSLTSALVMCAVFAAAGFALTVLWRRWMRSGDVEKEPAGSVLAGLLGAVIGAGLLCLQLKRAVISPDGISQSYDNIFHLNAIRYIADTGDGSSLTMLSMTSADGSGGFYPAAWHDITSLIFSVAPGSVPAATNAMTFAVAACAWPLSVVALAVAIAPRRPLLVLAAGVLSSAFLAFPGLTLKWGVLYPNMLGYAVLPAFLALMIQVLRDVEDCRRERIWPVGSRALVATAGLTLAHPNALTAGLLFLAPAVVARLAPLLRRRDGKSAESSKRSRVVQIGILGAMLAVVLVGFLLVRPDPSNATWGPSMTTSQAFGEYVLNAFNGNRSEWVVSLLVVLGVITSLRTRRSRWVVSAWLLCGLIWIVAAGMEQGALRTFISGPWYNDKLRLAGLSAIPAVLLAALGVDQLGVALARLLARRGSATRGVAPWGRISVAVLMVLVCAGLSRTRAMEDAWTSVAREYTMDPVSLLLTSDEQKVLDHVDEVVPAGDVIVVDPWDGSALAYSLEDRSVTARHTLSATRTEFEPIVEHLDDPAYRDQVCQAVQRTGARWYLDFDDTLDIGHDFQSQYPGLQDVPESGMVTPVYTSGDVGLYRISGCSG